MANIKIDTQLVVEYSEKLRVENEKLTDLLQDSSATVNALKNHWTGEASEETAASFNRFANKYFAVYHDTLDGYVKYLKNLVVEQYGQTETANTGFSAAFDE